MSNVRTSTGAFRRINNSSTTKGQAQLLALFLILALVPTAVIVAQNATNSTGLEGMVTNINLTEPVTIDEPLNETLPDAPQEENQTVPGENATIPEENVTIPEENITIPDENVTIPDDNATLPEENITLPDENAILEENVTEPENATEPEINVTEPEANVTEPEENVTVDERIPELTISIEHPEKMLRGESITASATLSNTGDPAENVVLEWVLSDGFEIRDGNALEFIGTLGQDESSTSEVRIYCGAESGLGANDIKVRASYE